MAGPQVELPFDILEIIVDIIASEVDLTDDSTSLPLKLLSLTCKSMVPLCHKHLFSPLHLKDSGHCTRFKLLLSNNPGIILFVRHLRFIIDDPFNPDAHEILSELTNRSTALQSIYLWSPSGTWDTFPPSLQILSDRVIHLPSITTLELSDIANIPATIFSGCVNLTSITLQEVNFIFPDSDSDVQITAGPVGNPRPKYLNGEYESYSAIRSLMQLRGPKKDQRTVDFSCLERIKFYITHSAVREVIWEVLQIATSVRFLELRTYGPLPWAGLGAALTSSSAIFTLRKLSISTIVTQSDYDPLCDLVAELQILAGTNKLEEISLDITCDVDVLCRPGTEDWASFDSLLARPGSFPVLRVVSVEVMWYTVCINPQSVLDIIVREEDFPMLVNSEAVDFRFLVEHRYA